MAGMRLRTLFSLMLACLLLLTAGFVGGIGYSTSHKEIRHHTEKEFSMANGAATREVSEFLNDPANRLLDEFALRARRGMFNLKDDRALGLDLAERLRVNRSLAWITYSDAVTGHFVGVWRNSDGAIVLNISTPGQGQAREEIITKEGKEIPIDRARPKDFDPRQREWFKSAIASDTTVWSEPYLFVDGVKGITASRAWKATDSGTPLGVFTVDFYLKDLETLLNSVASKMQSLSVILAPDGDLICSSTHPDAVPLSAALSAWVKSDPNFKNATSNDVRSHLIPMKVGGTDYIASLDHVQSPSGLTCIVAAIIPEDFIFSRIKRMAQQMEIIAAGGMLVALALGWLLAYRVSEPLRALGSDLAKVGQFHLASNKGSPSAVQEVNQLRDAADRMKSGLRSFIKYVPDDLVRQLLSSGKEAMLGGEVRRLTIFFFDIEGFTAHSERVSPAVLVHELADYFEILSRRLRQHSGTIDKFIGDGLLGFFNAPEKVTNHENQACRATLIGLQELELRQKDPAKIPFRTRVGLHCGDVLVGNIGTPERFAYTVLGDVVNVASRLESLNKVYGTHVIASGEVHASAGNDFEWRHLDRVAVFGRQGGMDIYELMGLKDGVDEDRLYRRKRYEEALDLYLNRSFWDARSLFAQIVEKCPSDKAAVLMMTRCDHMVAHEPAPDWNGVFVYTVKTT